MQLTNKDLQILCRKAILAAKKAGKLISSYSNKELNIKYKKTSEDCTTKPKGGKSLASQIITEVDLKSQDIILKVLSPTFKQFDLGLLTEELADDNSRFKKDYFWCIDPLDGTLPFTEGKHGYSVSIALISKTGEPYIGVIYDPVKNNIYWALKDGGVYKNESPWKLPQKTNVFCFITDRSLTVHPNFNKTLNEIESYAHDNGYAEVKHINIGGAAMNAIWVLENNPSCYFKFPKKEQGGGSIWDFAATATIFNELKVPTSDFSGYSLDLNRTDSTFMNHRGVIYSSNIKVASMIKAIK